MEKGLIITYVLRGSCEISFDNVCEKLQEGNFCISSDKIDVHVKGNSVAISMTILKSRIEECFIESYIDSSGEFLWRMIYNKSDCKHMIFRCNIDPDMEEAAVYYMDEASLGEKKSELILSSLALIFLGYALRNHQNEFNLKEKPFPLPAYISYMKDNLKTVTLRSLSEKFALSEGYLSRYFKKETGKTYSELIKEMRLKTASELLENTDFSVEKIIETIGYTDNSIFYRNFREKYGVTPKTYRLRFLMGLAREGGEDE
ncbi:MAG: helix-turn-helix transcriptional regulator [Clostridia bacterium]